MNERGPRYTRQSLTFLGTYKHYDLYTDGAIVYARYGDGWSSYHSHSIATLDAAMIGDIYPELFEAKRRAAEPDFWTAYVAEGEAMPAPDNKPKFQVQWASQRNEQQSEWRTVQLTFDSQEAAEDYILTQRRDLGLEHDEEPAILFRVYDVPHKVKFRAEWKWMAGNMEMRATHADPTLREAVAYVYQNVSLDNGGIHELTFTKVEYDEFV